MILITEILTWILSKFKRKQSLLQKSSNLVRKNIAPILKIKDKKLLFKLLFFYS